MENMITVFENEEFGAVRTATINGEPWFVANDVFRVLSVRNTKDALHTLDEDEKSGVDIIDPMEEFRERTASVNPDFTALYSGAESRRQRHSARWITHEVIPAIRKHGMYATTPMLRQFQENPGAYPPWSVSGCSLRRTARTSSTRRSRSFSRKRFL